MKRLYVALLLGSVIPMQAQAPQSFQEFRKQIFDDYENFRKTILDHYADFLNGTWHEYEPLLPLERDNTPKPMAVPDVNLTKPSVSPKGMPSPKLAALPPSARPIPVPEQEPEQEPEPEEPVNTNPFGDDVPKTIVPPEAGKEVPPSLKVRPDLGAPLLASLPESVRPVPKISADGTDPTLSTNVGVPDDARLGEVDLKPIFIPNEEEESAEGKEPVNFYGMEILVPQVDFQIMRSFSSVADFARNWKLLEEQDVKDDLLDALKPKMESLGLNDYLTYEFLCAYMDSKFPEAASAPKMSVVHYLLSQMGYSARIGMAVRSGDPVILMPMKQKVYGKMYMPIDGETHYLMTAPDANVAGQGIATCDLPKLANSGKKFDLVVNGLNLPVKEHEFEVSYGGITLSGVVNENLMPVVYRYPQMETADYAASELDGGLRKSLVEQIKAQLGDKDKLTATNNLLQFIQSGFEYATDDDFHGFEKPYFLEENFYYPKNDCEDRAMLYTYMLWNALGVENQLLFFPGHESASVSLDGNITGTSYEHEGKRYFISDPTYIGSRTGQCMPQYESTAPVIDRSLPTK